MNARSRWLSASATRADRAEALALGAGDWRALSRVYPFRAAARWLAGDLERLVISERTAENHISRMLGKLGLQTRAQLAVWAVEHGLGTRRAR